MPVTTPVKSPKASVVEFITRSVEKMKLKDSVEHTCSILHRTSDVTSDKSQKSSVADIITRPVETIETKGNGKSAIGVTWKGTSSGARKKLFSSGASTKDVLSATPMSEFEDIKELSSTSTISPPTTDRTRTDRTVVDDVISSLKTLQKKKKSILFSINMIHTDSNIVEKVVKELQVTVPFLYDLLDSMIGESHGSKQSTIATIYGMIMHSRNNHASLMQRLWSVAAIHCHADNKGEILCPLMIMKMR